MRRSASTASSYSRCCSSTMRRLSSWNCLYSVSGAGRAHFYVGLGDVRDSDGDDSCDLIEEALSHHFI